MIKPHAIGLRTHFTHPCGVWVRLCPSNTGRSYFGNPFVTSEFRK